jgi:hypothetical protein
VDHGVELVGHRDAEVVALPFRVRAVDDADRAFRARLAKHLGRLRDRREGQHELLVADLVEQLFDAAG